MSYYTTLLGSNVTDGGDGPDSAQLSRLDPDLGVENLDRFLHGASLSYHRVTSTGRSKLVSREPRSSGQTSSVSPQVHSM